jgi:DNA-binding response OmpR family regulator
MFRRYRNRVQLLLCDAVLPDSSGALLAQALRRRAAAVKVILVSGYPSATLQGYLSATPGNEFLAKPYCAASLISKVQMVLREKG